MVWVIWVVSRERQTGFFGGTHYSIACLLLVRIWTNKSRRRYLHAPTREILFSFYLADPEAAHKERREELNTWMTGLGFVTTQLGALDL